MHAGGHVSAVQEKLEVGPEGMLLAWKPWEVGVAGDHALEGQQPQVGPSRLEGL